MLGHPELASAVHLPLRGSVSVLEGLFAIHQLYWSASPRRVARRGHADAVVDLFQLALRIDLEDGPVVVGLSGRHAVLHAHAVLTLCHKALLPLRGGDAADEHHWLAWRRDQGGLADAEILPCPGAPHGHRDRLHVAGSVEHYGLLVGHVIARRRLPTCGLLEVQPIGAGEDLHVVGAVGPVDLDPLGLAPRAQHAGRGHYLLVAVVPRAAPVP
mmetsp:Transcript_22339/g.59538  ORF Transcript_22339/g.59538 Transcript_22339/m.59538 type:complete len:214 (+) Transcript_22339:118-759(+)